LVKRGAPLPSKSPSVQALVPSLAVAFANVLVKQRLRREAVGFAEPGMCKAGVIGSTSRVLSPWSFLAASALEM
jgi:hypothetical protein